MVNQIILLLCFFSISCASNDSKNKSKEQHITASIDTIKIINEIKKQYIAVNAKEADYNKVEKDILGQSAEGGIIIAYYHKSDLKKVITTYYGETGKAVTEYYFNNEGLFFALKSEYFYNKPIYEEGSKVVSIDENRYYFYKHTILKWLDKNKKSVSSDAKEYQQENKYFIEDTENFKKELGDYNPNNNSVILGDTVRCKYGDKCPDTGYIIKGSRASNGRVIHVSPKVKNVPAEK